MTDVHTGRRQADKGRAPDPDESGWEGKPRKAAYGRLTFQRLFQVTK